MESATVIIRPLDFVELSTITLTQLYAFPALRTLHNCIGIKMASRPELKFPLQPFIDGDFAPPASGRTFPVVDPSTEEEICRVGEACEEDVNRAVAAAAKAFAPGSPWRTMDASARGRLLLKLADLVERDADYIARLDSWNNGKPFADCIRYDLPGTFGLIRYYAGWAGELRSSRLSATRDT